MLGRLMRIKVYKAVHVRPRWKPKITEDWNRILEQIRMSYDAYMYAHFSVFCISGCKCYLDHVNNSVRTNKSGIFDRC